MGKLDFAGEQEGAREGDKHSQDSNDLHSDAEEDKDELVLHRVISNN